MTGYNTIMSVLQAEEELTRIKEEYVKKYYRKR